MLAVVNLTTVSVALLPTLDSTTALILSNDSGSAGNVTFTSSTTLFANQTVAPGASVTIDLVPRLGDALQGPANIVSASAATTALARVQRLPY